MLLQLQGARKGTQEGSNLCPVLSICEHGPHATDKHRAAAAPSSVCCPRCEATAWRQQTHVDSQPGKQQQRSKTILHAAAEQVHTVCVRRTQSSRQNSRLQQPAPLSQHASHHCSLRIAERGARQPQPHSSLCLLSDIGDVLQELVLSC